MHSALWKLVWFDLRGSLRGLLKLRSSWRQLFLFFLMLAFIGLFVGSQLLGAHSGEGSGMGGRFGSAMPFWASMYLMATWLTASADRGLVMRPAEIHFIVAGPFPTRDMITLNLVRLAYRAAISASVLALISLAYTQSFLASLVGLWLLISVSLLVGMIVSLSLRGIHSVWIHRLRRLMNVTVMGVLVGMIAQAMALVRDSGEDVTVPHVAAAAIQSPIGQFVLPPVEWMFAPLTVASFWPAAVLLLPLRLLVVGVLAALVYLLGGEYREATTARTDLSVTRRQNALRSGLSSAGGWTSRVTLPQFGRMAGMGSIAWMQMVHSIRILPRFLAFTVAIIAVVIVIPMMVDKQHLDGWSGVLWMAGLNTYADFLLLLQLPVGFLGPPAQRVLLKSLPISAWAVVIGQLAGPVIPLAALHAMVLGLFLYLLPNAAIEVVQTSLALIPVAWVLTANVNLLAAWNIIKPRALQQRDALAAGRAMASVWIFFLMLIPAIVSGLLGATVVAMYLGPTLAAYLAGASVGTALASVLYVLLLTHSFAHWQPAVGDGSETEKEHDA
jgi:hypothetical protein